MPNTTVPAAATGLPFFRQRVASQSNYLEFPGSSTDDSQCRTALPLARILRFSENEAAAARRATDIIGQHIARLTGVSSDLRTPRSEVRP